MTQQLLLDIDGIRGYRTVHVCVPAIARGITLSPQARDSHLRRQQQHRFMQRWANA